MNTIVLEKMPDKFWDLVKERNLMSSITPYNDSIDKKKVDAIILRTRIHCDEDFIDDYPNVKLIIRAGTGFDNIEIEAMKKKGVMVCNTPEANAQSAFEHTLALLLAVMKQLNHARNNVIDGKWKSDLDYNLEFEDLKVLVVGVGRIGTKVATTLKYLGAEVKGVDPYLTESEKKLKNIDFINYQDGLKWANVISYHCPLTAETFHYFKIESFKFINKKIILINASRGSVVDEKALLFGLENRKFIGVGLDVFENEPTDQGDFIDYQNVFYTPHIGAFTKKAKERMSFETLEVLGKFMKNEKINSRII